MHLLQLVFGMQWWQGLLFWCGIALLPGTLAIIWQELRAHWDQTTGIITNIYVALPGSWHKKYFTPLVEFTYSVRDQTITSMTFWDRQPICETMELAEKEIGRYTIGMPTTVKYRPDYPVRAFVVSEPRWRTALGYVLLTGGAFLLAIYQPEFGQHLFFVLGATVGGITGQVQWLKAAPRTVSNSAY